MRSAPSSCISLTTHQHRRGDVGERSGLTIAQSNIQMLTSSCLPSRDQASHDGVASIQSGCQISDCNADFDWWAVSFSGDVHESHLCFDHDVVTGSQRIWSGLAIASYRSIYEARVEFV